VENSCAFVHSGCVLDLWKFYRYVLGASTTVHCAAGYDIWNK
jgi:hypothetical protein